MSAIARTPVLLEATPQGALSARRRSSWIEQRWVTDGPFADIRLRKRDCRFAHVSGPSSSEPADPGWYLGYCRDPKRGAMSETRKLAAILAADVVGFSRLTGADEDRTLARLRALRSDLIDPTIAVHHGRVVKRTGDGALVEFRSVVDAVRCAVEIQNAMVERNAGVETDRRIEFRIGIHLGPPSPVRLTTRP